MGSDISESQNTFVTCAKCGASNPAVSEFCRQCGDAGISPATAGARARHWSPLRVAAGASILTAIPLICLHFVLLAHGIRQHDETLRRRAELSVNVGGTQISLNASKWTPQDTGDSLKRGLDQVKQSNKLTALESERDKLKVELQAMSRRIKQAEDKYEESDRQLRNANGDLRELREELAARNEQQARTMQKLVDTERQLRSTQVGNSKGP